MSISSHARQRLPRTVHYWVLPMLYVVAAILLGFLLPRIDRQYLPAGWTTISINSETAILSSIASGMMALTGIVFSMVLVTVQVAGTSYSPRLVQWLIHDRILRHALGVFTATFIFALMALAAVDVGNSGRVPIVTTFVAMFWLLASIVVLIALIERVGRLYVSNVLNGVGERGRAVIREIYAPNAPMVHSVEPPGSDDPDKASQEIFYHGPPLVLVALDLRGLMKAAQRCGGLIKVEYAVGDLVADGLPIARVYGAVKAADVRLVRRAIVLGKERIILQDPKYPLRLLVDIAIRALSPAVNDPTTAVQALNQIDDLLRRLGRARLDVGRVADKNGVLRIMYPTPTWEDFIDLALLEILYYGANSVQVMRRMGALLDDLEATVNGTRQEEVRKYQARLRRQIEQTFKRSELREEAEETDRQGLGLTRRDGDTPE
jgi:uncharacterized membrane protein